MLILLSFLNGISPVIGSASANPSGANEYAIKAAYIYNILRFIDWNQGSPLADTEQLTVCLYRHNPFNGQLDSLEKKQ